MSKKLWGGRFAKKTHPLVEKFTKSIQYDCKLAEYDLVGSMIHVEILRKANFLKAEEAARLYKALNALYGSVTRGEFKHDTGAEDIHTDIQNKLLSKVGEVALKLHTARSRNEQVVFATKLYCKVELAKTEAGIAGLKASICKIIAKNKGVIIPGLTHMQHAQPVYLEDYLLAYVDMLSRDSLRLENIFKNIRLTMGAGALAGTPIEASKYIVRPSKYLKGASGIDKSFYINPVSNSLDAVSDRDFVIEILNALSLIGMHLSRLSEDLIIWSTREFSFIEIDDSFCTGSSLMPQKKNPDVLELIRGYAGRLYGNLVSVLTTMKGLPLSYNRDMQLDKEPLFSSFEIVSGELAVLAPLIESIRFNKARIEDSLEDESLYATDLVYYLVKKGEPFTRAHTIVGKLIKYSIDNSIDIKSMSDTELAKFSDKFKREEILKLFNPRVSVESKKSIRR